MKKIFALVLSAMMVLSMVSCGGSTATTAAGTTAAATTKAAAGTTAAATEAETTEKAEPKEITIGIVPNSYITSYEDNAFTTYIEEYNNCKITFYYLPTDSAELSTKIALMAAGGADDVPDILMDSCLNSATAYQLGASGFLVELDDYMEDPEIMPNWNAIEDDDYKAEFKAGIVSADGHYYSFGDYNVSYWNSTPCRMFINQTWLDKLGLETPTTTDELEQVLLAFRDGDPNGNGLQDEIGIFGWYGGTYGQCVQYGLMNAFQYYTQENYGLTYVYDEDGNTDKTVEASFTTDAFREGLSYMNRLYEEGVLSGDIFTTDNNGYKATLNQDTNIVGFVSSGSLGNWTDFAQHTSNLEEMSIIAPLTGPNGVNYSMYKHIAVTQKCFITSACEDPEFAATFLDSFYDYEVWTFNRFGVEDVNWSRDPEVIAKSSNAYYELGLVDEIVLVNNAVDLLEANWSSPSNSFWHSNGPKYASETWSMQLGTYDYDIETDANAKPNAANVELYVPAAPTTTLPLLKFTEEETSKISDMIVSIPSYVDTAFAEFVTGTKDIDNDADWEAYKKDLETMGLSTLIEVAQGAADRLN